MPRAKGGPKTRRRHKKVMKAAKGKANPRLVDETLRRLLAAL